MNKPSIIITLLMSLTMTSACSLILPWELSTALTAGDFVLATETGKSSSEHIAEELTGKQCRWSRALQEESLCMTEKEYVNYIMAMRCKVYTWDVLGLPSCKDDVTEQNIKYSVKQMSSFLGE
jgi:hypothetical protein